MPRSWSQRAKSLAGIRSATSARSPGAADALANAASTRTGRPGSPGGPARYAWTTSRPQRGPGIADHYAHVQIPARLVVSRRDMEHFVVPAGVAEAVAEREQRRDPGARRSRGSRSAGPRRSRARRRRAPRAEPGSRPRGAGASRAACRPARPARAARRPAPAHRLAGQPGVDDRRDLVRPGHAGPACRRSPPRWSAGSPRPPGGRVRPAGRAGQGSGGRTPRSRSARPTRPPPRRRRRRARRDRLGQHRVARPGRATIPSLMASGPSAVGRAGSCSRDLRLPARRQARPRPDLTRPGHGLHRVGGHRVTASATISPSTARVSRPTPAAPIRCGPSWSGPEAGAQRDACRARPSRCRAAARPTRRTWWRCGARTRAASPSPARNSSRTPGSPGHRVAQRSGRRLRHARPGLAARRHGHLGLARQPASASASAGVDTAHRGDGRAAAALDDRVHRVRPDHGQAAQTRPGRGEADRRRCAAARRTRRVAGAAARDRPAAARPPAASPASRGRTGQPDRDPRPGRVLAVQRPDPAGQPRAAAAPCRR